MTEQLRDTWKPVLIELQQMLKPTEFMTWFRNTALLNMENKVATIGVPVEAAIHRIQTRHKDTIIKAFKANEIEIGNIKFEVDNALNNESDDRVISLKSVKQVATKIKRKAQTDGIRISENISSRVLNPKYTLDNFIVGSGSQLAHAAFKAVCKNPGKSYNPLFIYGGVGLGKTHLLQSSGNEILKTDRDKLVVYTTSEKFTSELVSAIQGGVKIIDKWKKQYRKVDVFIVDDIQFIAGKQQTQEEIFHIFNILKEAGKQIIFSSDRPPKEIKKLDDRLVSRFESGMIVDIQQPDFETRSAILSSKAQEQGKFLPSDVIEYIAHNVSDSVRQLEGVLTQFLAEMDLLDIEPSINLAESVLRRNGTITQIESLNNPSSSG
ncbi:MAG: chromosomal replication initiator protein DnaA [Patescibacteria group bacterium]|nr:chromosomal replication initiator protein DnaA [Patescibacteria group bacterium]